VSGPSIKGKHVSHVTGPKPAGVLFYVVREPTLIDSILPGSVLVHSAALLSTHVPSHISHGTDTIMTRYDTGRTEIPFGPVDVCIWVSPFLVQDSPIEGTLHQCPFCGIISEPLN
jgi:hypothetical protein